MRRYIATATTAITTTAALFLTCCLSSYATAQTVYRCGNSYGQTPCANGVPLNVSDSRSAAQKAEAEKIAARDAATARGIEKERLRQEALAVKTAAAASAPKPAVPAAQAAKMPTEKSASTSEKKSKKSEKKNKDPEFFTAKSTPTKKP